MCCVETQLQLVENLMREDMNAIEKAKGILESIVNEHQMVLDDPAKWKQMWLGVRDTLNRNPHN